MGVTKIKIEKMPGCNNTQIATAYITKVGAIVLTELAANTNLNTKQRKFWSIFF